MGAGLNIDVGCCTVEYVYDDAAGYVYDVVASGLLVTIVVTKGVCCIDVVSIGFSRRSPFRVKYPTKPVSLLPISSRLERTSTSQRDTVLDEREEREDESHDVHGHDAADVWWLMMILLI